ncbi:MAG: hypothetical protein IH991_05420 [Planctomycetes bacterium]|nr:hypothetical protein [Planctomycetota bacterium]
MPIETRQAGESVTCPQCAAALAVPAMRNIRKLKPEENETAQKSSAQPWTRQQGLIFAGGVMLALVATVVAIGFYLSVKKLPIAVPKPVEQQLEQELESLHKEIDAAGPADLWSAWRQIKQFEFGEWTPPQHIENRERRDRRMLYVKIAIGCAALGVGLAIGSFLIRPRRI